MQIGNRDCGMWKLIKNRRLRSVGRGWCRYNSVGNFMEARCWNSCAEDGKFAGCLLLKTENKRRKLNLVGKLEQNASVVTRWRRQICRARHEGRRQGAMWLWMTIEGSYLQHHVYGSNLTGCSCHGSIVWTICNLIRCETVMTLKVSISK